MEQEKDKELEEETDTHRPGISLTDINTSDKNVAQVTKSQVKDPICTQFKKTYLPIMASKIDAFCRTLKISLYSQ